MIVETSGHRDTGGFHDHGIPGQDRISPATLATQETPAARQAGANAPGHRCLTLSLHESHNDGPAMLFPPGQSPQRWPMDVVAAASVGHCCGWCPPSNRNAGPSLRPTGHYGHFVRQVSGTHPARRTRPGATRHRRTLSRRARPGHPADTRSSAHLRVSHARYPRSYAITPSEYYEQVTEWGGGLEGKCDLGLRSSQLAW